MIASSTATAGESAAYPSRPAGRRRGARRRLGMFALVAAGSVALSGCAFLYGQQTQDWYDPVDGGNTKPGPSQSFVVRDAVVGTDGDTTQAWATFITYGDADELVGVSVAGTPLTIEGETQIRPGVPLRLGPPGDTSATGTGIELTPGLRAEVTFTFREAAEQTLSTIVRDTS